MKAWRICGLRFASDIDLRPLPAAAKSADEAKADVVVRRTRVAKNGIKNPRLTRALMQAGDGSVWFDVPGIARFQIDGGREVRVQPYPDADERSIVLFLLGSALGAVLHQRGFLVLHANAVLVDGGAVLLAGHSGAGKSTTAAALLERGYEVLADDVTALDEAGGFAAGVPRLKLWKDALGKLDMTLEGLEQLRPQIDKYQLPLPSRRAPKKGSLPVKAIYILSSANELEPDKFELKRIEGTTKFIALQNQTYRPHFMTGLGLKPRHLKLCAALAARTPIARITRPTTRFNATALARRILEDLEDLRAPAAPPADEPREAANG